MKNCTNANGNFVNSSLAQPHCLLCLELCGLVVHTVQLSFVQFEVFAHKYFSNTTSTRKLIHCHRIRNCENCCIINCWILVFWRMDEYWHSRHEPEVYLVTCKDFLNSSELSITYPFLLLCFALITELIIFIIIYQFVNEVAKKPVILMHTHKKRKNKNKFLLTCLSYFAAHSPNMLSLDFLWARFTVAKRSEKHNVSFQ